MLQIMLTIRERARSISPSARISPRAFDSAPDYRKRRGTSVTALVLIRKHGHKAGRRLRIMMRRARHLLATAPQ
jgi:hypothetical protein